MQLLDIIFVLAATACAQGYLAHGTIADKEQLLADAFLRDVARLAWSPRAQPPEQLDYDALLSGDPSPSLRDHEYLQHSSLWGHQYVSGGAGEGVGGWRVKSDAALPAYCDPPNPCPVGYTEEQGCITSFENTAAFSREYQLAQRCMCDGEHMFRCPDDSLLDFRNDHKNLVAKKFHPYQADNPFLEGEKLPIAAKKGFEISNFNIK